MAANRTGKQTGNRAGGEQAGDGASYDLGIDLGTTYVAAGILQQGRPEIITLGDRTPVLPSVLFFREDGEVLTGESATRRGLSDPTRVVREFKRRVGDTTPLVVGQTPYSVDVLMAELVRSVHEAVVERQGAAPGVIALTHPANWGPYKIDVLEQAVRIAGVGEVITITEPVAAAIHYAAAERLQPGQTVAVYDLGGGTFDAAVLRKTETDFTVLGEVEGIERLGGIDFDEAVFQHVVRFCGESLTELDVDDPATIQALARLRQECVEAKEVLSTDTEVTIPVVLPNLQTEIRLTRAEFEAMIRPLLSQTVEALGRAISSAEIDPQELSAVLLVGGCSRIPLIAEMVGAELGRPIAVDRHPKHTVALGAAIAAGRSVEAPEPHVDDWFRTEPATSSQPTQTSRTSTADAVLAAATAAGAVASAGDDPLSMFPMKDGTGDSEPVEAATPSPSDTAASGATAVSGAGSSGRSAVSGGLAEAEQTSRSRAESLGASPVRLPAPVVPVAAAAVSAAPPPAAVAQSSPSAHHSPGPRSFSNTGPESASSTGPGLGLGAGPGAGSPSFSDHQRRLPAESSKPGGRILMMAAVAVAAFLLLGGTAWAFTRSGSGTGPDDQGDQGVSSEPGAPGTEEIGDGTGNGVDPATDGQGNGAGNGNQGTLPDRTTTSADRTTASTARQTSSTSGQTTTTRPTTTTHHDTTSTTHDWTTTTKPTTTTTEATTTTIEDTTTTTEDTTTTTEDTTTTTEDTTTTTTEDSTDTTSDEAAMQQSTTTETPESTTEPE